MFQEKDHMNYRYFAKRACFLAWVALTLASMPAFKDMHFEALGGDANRPVLVIKPKGMGGSLSTGRCMAAGFLTQAHLQPLDPEGHHKTKFVIRVLPSLPADTFKSFRLTPDRNNVRPRHVSAVRDGHPHEGIEKRYYSG